MLDFDGIDDIVTMAKNPVEDGSISLESWFYPTDKSGGAMISAGMSYYYIRVTEAGGLHFRLTGQPEKTGNDYNWCDIYTANNIVELNKWHHVVVTFDSVTKDGIIYLDEKKVGKIPDNKKFQGCDTISSSGAIGIGGIYSGSLKKWEYNFDGQIASACVYNSALSEDSVKAHFAAGVGSCGRVGESNLQGGWFLDDWQQK